LGKEEPEKSGSLSFILQSGSRNEA